MKHIIILLLAFVFTLMISACSDNSSSDGDTDQLAIFAISTSGDFDLQTDGSASINFCYEGEGCTSTSGMTFYSVFNNQRMDLEISNSEKVAVGIQVGVVVTGGEGYFEVVRGESYREDGFLEFDEAEVVFTSEVFSSGQTAQFNWGNTD